MQMLFCEPRLGKVGGGWRVTKVSLYYGTNRYVPLSLVPAMSGGHRLPCPTSQIRTPYWDNLKNLAFAIEPPANPMRPTLPDGH